MAWRYYYERHGWSQSETENEKSRLLQCNLPMCEENVDEVLELLSALSDDQSPHLGAALGNTPGRSPCGAEPALRRRHFNISTQPVDVSCLYSWNKGSSSMTDQGPKTEAKVAETVRGSIPATNTRHVSTDKEEGRPHRKRWEKPEGVFARVAPFYSQESRRPGERRVCFGRDQIDASGEVCESQRHLKQRETLSTFEDLLESSWTSAALHRSMLDLENNEQEGCSTFSRIESILQKSLRHSDCDSKTQPSFREVDYHSEPNLSLFPVKKSSKSLGILGSQAQDRGRALKSAFGPRLRSPQEERCLQEAFSQPGLRPTMSASERDLKCRSSEPSPLLPSGDREWCEDCGLAVAEPVAAGETLVPSDPSWIEKLEMMEKHSGQTNLKVKEGWKSTQGPLERNHGDKVSHSFNGQSRLGISGPFEDATPFDGWRLSSKQMKSLSKTHSARGQSSKVKPDRLSRTGLKDALKAEPLSTQPQSCRLPEGGEIYGPGEAVGTDERFQALYRFRLLQRCFRCWAGQHRCLGIARQWHRWRVLSSALGALKQAAEKRHTQTHTLQHRHRALTLTRAFQHWKARVAGRQGQRSSRSTEHDGPVEDLRRRLIQPSSALVLRRAYCTWRRHSQGQELLRAALIHYHLALLFKHWLQWRRECVWQRRQAEQEEQAAQVWGLTLQTHTFTVWRTASSRHQRARQHWGRRLAKRALAAWRSAYQRQQQATVQHRLSALVRAWRVWVERLELRRRGRLVEAMESTEVHRRSVLQHCLLVWRRRTARRHTSREREDLTARKVLEHWRRLPHQRSLLRLACSLQQLFSRRTLEVAFGRWRAARAQVEARLGQEERLRLLQDRRRLRAALRRWRRALRVRRGVRDLQQRSQETQLSNCLKAWRGLVQRGATLSFLWDLREEQRIKQSFQHWRNAMELRTQHKHLLLSLLCSRQHSFLQTHEHTPQSTRQHTPTERDNDSCSVMETQRSLDELCHNLLLQKALHTWRENTLNMHKASLFCVAQGRERACVVLRRWHQLAQEEQSSGVLRFTARLAQLAQGTHTSLAFSTHGPLSASEITAGSGGICRLADHRSAELSDWSFSLSHRETHCPLLTSSPHCTQPADVCVADETTASGASPPSAHRLKMVAASALVRMLRPALAQAFTQWRSVTVASRDMRRRAELHGQTHTHTHLRRAFSIWRRERQKNMAAAKHRDRSLLLRSVCVWKECVCQSKRSLALKQRANEFHLSNLLTHSYSHWRQQCSLRTVRCDPEEEAQLMRKGAWLQRSGVRRRLSWSFSLWAARVRQNHAVQAVYTHTLFSRVFVAWEVCVRSRRQRARLAQAHLERSVCERAFRWWRTSTAQHQLANLRTIHTLHTLASVCLQRWNTHTQLLCEVEKVRERRMKRRALLMWTEALEKHQRAQHTHQLTLMKSCLQRWQWHAQHSVCVRAVCVWLQGTREERSLQWALHVWRGRLRLRLRRREYAWHSVGALAAVWRERALESRAQRHREDRVTLLAKQCLTAWRTYTDSVCVERVLVCEFEEERKRMRKSRALAAWRLEAQVKQAERHYHFRLLGGALQHWRSSLIGRSRSRERALVAVCVWRQRTFQSRELMERALEFRRRRHIAMLTHCFLRWNMACAHTHISQDFHRRAVCKRVLLGWYRHVETTQRNQYKEAWFQCGREQRLVRACFTHWQGEMRQAGLRQAALEQKLCQLSMWQTARALQYWRAATRRRAAQKRHSRSLLQKCFSVWREITEEVCVADDLRVENERRAAREALISWVKWAKDRRAQRMMVEAVCLWLDGRRVSRSFYLWLRAHQRHQEASRHHNILLLRRMFQAWHSVTAHTELLCEDMRAGVCKTLMRQVFHAWQRTAVSQRTVRVCEARRRGVLRGALSVWRKKFQTRQRRVLVLCEGVFSHWLQLVHRRRTEREVQRQHRLMKRYWCVWRECVQDSRYQRRLMQLHWACWKNRTATSLIVSTMHSDSVQQWAWLVWRRRRIRSRVAQSFSSVLNRTLLSEAFSVWRRRTLHPG